MRNKSKSKSKKASYPPTSPVHPVIDVPAHPQIPDTPVLHIVRKPMYAVAGEQNGWEYDIFARNYTGWVFPKGTEFVMLDNRYLNWAPVKNQEGS